MKKVRGTPAQIGNRRENLQRVCARLLREKGFEGTSICDILQAEGGMPAMRSSRVCLPSAC
ncbi:MAG: hypothetical protein OEO84_15980 [Betaproteobacteria bacterium]|nr:hypothetical protein [Betaproteobacteria bacterium]